MLSRDLLVEAWRGLTWSTLLRVAMALCLFNAIAIIPTIPSQRSGFTWGPYANAFLAMQIKGFCVFMLVMVADRISDLRRGALWPYAAAVFLGVVTGATLLWLLTQRLLGVPTAVSLARGLAYEPFQSFTYRHSNGAMIIFALATAAYFRRRRALRNLAEVRAAEGRSAALEQQLLHARLASMHARIEPESIITELKQADALYQHDVEAGTAALQSLARRLRMALAETRSIAAQSAAAQRITSS